MLLLYVTLSIWLYHCTLNFLISADFKANFLSSPVIYFWISIMALCIAPFLFNPHQFSLGDFIIDYREFLRWMTRGNSKAHANSWIGYCRLSRTKITGLKKKRMGHPSEKLSTDVPRATWRVVIFSEILPSLALAVIFTIAYMFVKVRFLFGRLPLTHANILRTLLLIPVLPNATNQCVTSNRCYSTRTNFIQRCSTSLLIHYFPFRWTYVRRMLR